MLAISRTAVILHPHVLRPGLPDASKSWYSHLAPEASDFSFSSSLHGLHSVHNAPQYYACCTSRFQDCRLVPLCRQGKACKKRMPGMGCATRLMWRGRRKIEQYKKERPQERRFRRRNIRSVTPSPRAPGDGVIMPPVPPGITTVSYVGQSAGVG